MVEAFFAYFKNHCLDFVCTSQLFYRDQVCKLSVALRRKIESNNSLRPIKFLKSVNNLNFICKTCNNYLLREKVTPESALNGFNYEDIPPEVKKLNSLEEHLIVLNVPFIRVMERSSGGQLACKGGIANVPSRVSDNRCNSSSLESN